MTREELIEKVARALCWKNGQNPELSLGGDGENFLWMEYEGQAEFAIDIVLEEAEKIADEFDIGRRVYDARGNLQDSSAGGKIAKRIRALKGK